MSQGSEKTKFRLLISTSFEATLKGYFITDFSKRVVKVKRTCYLPFSQSKVCFHYVFAIDVTVSCEELMNLSPPLGGGPDTCLSRLACEMKQN